MASVYPSDESTKPHSRRGQNETRTDQSLLEHVATPSSPPHYSAPGNGLPYSQGAQPHVGSHSSISGVCSPTSPSLNALCNPHWDEQDQGRNGGTKPPFIVTGLNHPEPRFAIYAPGSYEKIAPPSYIDRSSAHGGPNTLPTPASTVVSEGAPSKNGPGPKIWTGAYFLPRFVRAAEVPGEGMCYFYDDGSHCKVVIDGEAVNAHWGVTKAGKPRKRFAIACVTCREKKIKCDPDYPRCVQCEKFGRICKFKNALVQKRGEEEQDDSDQHDSQRPRKRISLGPAETSKKSFACPYLKKDSIEYHECCMRRLNRIRDVKQHLARRHTPERYCSMCFKTSFANQSILQDHISDRSCTIHDPSVLKGVSYDQPQQLSKKSDSKLTEEGQWFAIWEIIFAGSPKQASAYIDAGLSVEMRLFSEYSYTRGPAMLSEAILSNPNCSKQGITEEERWGALE
ncbi:hypothetical protein BGZ61DRAFT_535749 [Ilyonectria robusta]|uniref:uncharacterized protein n=1 Tax=Ilyonectria robusta TaxID=1079257 RepID=UPI001E8ED3A5|nr:uncharacterized protein BGZ61DRAFT_535749 [Ilyonectria robusta]KAH8679347.1 hypothetical protein BGZ61DRAFT_535749 [Ilyonectria robusta]